MCIHLLSNRRSDTFSDQGKTFKFFLMEYKSQPENRTVVVKTIDRLFYEKNNAKRSHKRAFELFTHPLYGLCEESNRNYLKKPNDLLQTFPLPEHLLYLLKLDVSLVKNLSLQEAAHVLRWACTQIETVMDRAKKEHVSLNAATLISCLTEQERP